jgi:hypothetical protein
MFWTVPPIMACDPLKNASFSRTFKAGAFVTFKLLCKSEELWPVPRSFDELQPKFEAASRRTSHVTGKNLLANTVRTVRQLRILRVKVMSKET